MPELIRPSRRGFITGLVSLISTPAVIRVAKLMPISLSEEPIFFGMDFGRGNETTYAITAINRHGLLTIKEILMPEVEKFVNSYSFMNKLDKQYSTLFGAPAGVYDIGDIITITK